MQFGPYIADRMLPKLLADYCLHAGLNFQSYSDEWVLRVAKGELVRWIVGYKFDVNRSAAGEVAQDKVAAYSALHAAGIAAVPHYLVRSLPHELIRVRQLRQALKGTSVVAKPLQGTAGRDVAKYQNVDEALNMIRSSDEPAWALSPYQTLRAEYRLIMLDGALLLAYEKTKPVIRGDVLLYNLSHGAIAAELKPVELRDELLAIALNVMDAMSLRLAAVDIVRLNHGELAVLEVNDGISMEHYARQSEGNHTRAKHVYETIFDALFS
jgi:glutathione synthase/RimK-type ligase-like ATP-grasp enzyme